MNAAPVALAVHQLTVRFGGIVALSDIDLTVTKGCRHGILGPNGSGKTTLFNSISGLNTPASGTISLLGTEVTSRPARERARMGLSRTFQITSLFPSLTVHENVAMATRMSDGVSGNWWKSASAHAAANTEATAMLDRLHIGHLAPRAVRSLGYGEQRQLEIAMALATRPAVLLLDEPTAGLSNLETVALTELVRALPPELTVLIIEHDLGVIFEVTDQLTVLQNGVVIANGPSSEIREDPIVKEVYLGQ